MKKFRFAHAITCRLLVAITILSFSVVNAQTTEQWEKMKGDINLFIANDLGRNGYYDQKPIAELMGEMAETIGPECIIAAGDVHHFNGVASVDDPLWTTNFELIYSHPELMIDWLPVLGNHEYRGNTQAVMDYSKKSRRWVSGERYYTRVFNDKKAGVAVRIVMLDTTPLISKYCKDNEEYPDACKQDVNQQIAWLDSVLSVAKEEWVIVIGHHPIYAQTAKSSSERDDMQKRLLPILHRYNNVDMYICGHIHNFQHIRKEGDEIDYIVNSAGSLARPVSSIEGTRFCSPEPGFSVVSVTKNNLKVYMVDKSGTNIYTTIR